MGKSETKSVYIFIPNKKYDLLICIKYICIKRVNHFKFENNANKTISNIY